MKTQQAITNAFNKLQATLNTGATSQHIISTLITLAWVLDILPPHVDEITTKRMVGDPRESLTHLIDGRALTKHIREVKAS